MEQPLGLERPQADISAIAAPRLSICIVNWNCRDYLRRLLQSLQTEREDVPLEIIVLDNASSDDSACMVAAEFPQVRLVHNLSHQGIARANNRAAALAQSDLLLFLNNDTIVRPGTLSSLVRLFETHPEIVAAGPSLVFPDGRRQRTVRKTLGLCASLHRILLLRWIPRVRAADREYRQANFNLGQSGYVENLVGAALLLRRQAFASVGGWDEVFEFRMDDVDLSRRIARVGKIYYLAEAEIVHWEGVAAELDETYAYVCGERSYAHYLRKHYGVKAARIHKFLVTVDMPLRIFTLALTGLVKRISGDRERAARDYRKLTAATRFLLHELPSYWRCS